MFLKRGIKMAKKILVIDDDQAVRDSFILALDKTKYKVDTARNGEEGIKKFYKNKYNLVFLDLKMPKKDGVETLKDLRKMDRSVPVYIITAFAKEFFEKLKTVQQKGLMFELLQKPISKEQIILVSKGILEGPVNLK